jgi:hypothetical protein
MVNLVAAHDIVEAAHAVDAEFWPVHQLIKTRLDRGRRLARAPGPDRGTPSEFCERRPKAPCSAWPPLHRLTGRPAANDAFWQFRRSYFSPDQNRHTDTPP